MGLRIIHSGDWHLGHSLHGLTREHEHGRFLAWLADTLEERRADALIVAGDLFDSANPPASAQAMLYRFLVQAGRRCPGLQVVLIAGNHDSPARLEAPSSILDALNVRVVGAVRRLPDGRLDTAPLIVALRDRDGAVAARCAAIPYLRPSDLRLPDGGDGDLADGVAALYAEALAAIEAERSEDEALIALGHCYMVGTSLSELSERRILGGNQHALPAGVFPDCVTYAALGHLHLAQRVGGRDHVRYSGSPIPLALDERRYRHQVVQVDIERGRLAAWEALPVPRAVEILRVPERGAAPAEGIEAALAALVLDESLPPECHPYLEVAVRLPRPDPSLRRRVEEALAGRPVRLLKLTVEYAGGDGGGPVPSRRLTDIDPAGVFLERWRRQYEGEPPGSLLAAFHELLQGVQEEEP